MVGLLLHRNIRGSKKKCEATFLSAALYDMCIHAFFIFLENYEVSI